jgi:hypothetical protein
VALGQDHTLALTSAGEVLSWGLSRFHQLGYVVEPSTTTGRLEEPIQATPRKIYGPLKKELVKGVAASKQCSACWTATEVFTWGTNNGQLGYDKAAQPIQIVPRKVSKVVRPVMAISLTVRPPLILMSFVHIGLRTTLWLVSSTPKTSYVFGMIDTLKLCVLFIFIPQYRLKKDFAASRYMLSRPRYSLTDHPRP